MTESEKIKILGMIDSGKITPDQGIELLAACSASSPGNAAESSQMEGFHSSSPQWVRVIVTDLYSGKKKVNVRMPATLVSTSAKFGARLSLEKQHFNSEFLRDSIRNHKVGRVLDVADDEEGERVEIILE